VGFWFAFMPLYILGLMGVTRRMRVFDDPSLQIWFQIAAFGALMIAGGIACMFIQFAVSIKNREALKDVTGDPWDGRTLEWATSSPPPDYNFAFTPVIHDGDAWAHMKKHGYQRPTDGYDAIHMPSNTGTGIIIAGLSIAFSVGMIWYMWWLAGLSFVAILAVAIGHTFNYKRDFYIPADVVTRTEGERTHSLAAQG
jgi:cytochrome o ubiquinol oxidase subunit 1